MKTTFCSLVCSKFAKKQKSQQQYKYGTADKIVTVICLQGDSMPYN